MNELIKVTESNGNQAVSARDLYKFLEASERFANWIERQFQYGFIENVDYIGCKEFNTLANQYLNDFALTIDCAKEISMLQKNDKGKIARQYFIEVEKKYKQNNLPTSYLDALKALVISEEQKQLAESKVLELEPKAEVFDKLSNGINHLTFADASKSLNWGRNTLLKVLRNRMILRHNNTPYQRYIDEGYFVVKISPINISGAIQNMPQTYVTAKGLIWLSKTL